MDRSFPSSRRLRIARDFQRAWQGGRRLRTAHFTVLLCPNEVGQVRLGVTVSRKVGNAVCRNRLKRWLREFFRTELVFLYQSLDISIIAKPGAGRLAHAEMIEELRQRLCSTGDRKSC